MCGNRKSLGAEHSRHGDHAEVQPVPGVPEEGELPDTEASSEDLHQGFKRIDASKCVPVEESTIH